MFLALSLHLQRGKFTGEVRINEPHINAGHGGLMGLPQPAQVIPVSGDAETPAVPFRSPSRRPVLNIVGGYDATADLFIELPRRAVDEISTYHHRADRIEAVCLISTVSNQHSNMQICDMV